MGLFDKFKKPKKVKIKKEDYTFAKEYKEAYEKDPEFRGHINANNVIIKWGKTNLSDKDANFYLAEVISKGTGDYVYGPTIYASVSLDRWKELNKLYEKGLKKKPINPELYGWYKDKAYFVLTQVRPLVK